MQDLARSNETPLPNVNEKNDAARDQEDEQKLQILPEEHPPAFALLFENIEQDDLQKVGGKGLSLGIVAQHGLPVPTGFCITTNAYQRFTDVVPHFKEARDALEKIPAEDTDAIRKGAAKMRAQIGATPFPDEISAVVTSFYKQVSGDRSVNGCSFAVRSSATLEDLPEASFAGQHDSFLEVQDVEEVLKKSRDCFASLFTDRAVAYRRRQKLKEVDAQMAVVVQVMAASEVAGVLFTADPVSGNRDVCVIDASYGLGEAVVSGVVNPDGYRVKKDDGVLLSHHIGDKSTSIVRASSGGVHSVQVAEKDRVRRALDDDMLQKIVALGRNLESLYGQPQDVEWGFENGDVKLLQSRPITSLFPLPKPLGEKPPNHDDMLRVYVCSGHQQANPAVWSPMTTSMLGLVASFSQTKPLTSAKFTFEAGHRLFFDVTALMHHFLFRKIVPQGLMELSPAIGTRLEAVADNADFVRERSKTHLRWWPSIRVMTRMIPKMVLRTFLRSPQKARADWSDFLMKTKERVESKLAGATTDAETLHVVAEECWGVGDEAVFSLVIPVLAPGMVSVKVLSALMQGRIPEQTVTTFASALEGNVVTEMNALLGELAETARELPKVGEAIAQADLASMLLAAQSDDAGDVFKTQWDDFMSRYGHRGAGELDIARPRWRDEPKALLHVLSGILQDKPKEQQRRLSEAKAASLKAEKEIVEAASQGLLGVPRRGIARWLIRRVRGYMAMREHHKFWIIQLWGQLRIALLDTGATAVKNGWLKNEDDVFMLHLDELAAAFNEVTEASAKAKTPLSQQNALEETWRTLRAVVQTRQDEHRRFARISPPAVLLSNGEVPTLLRRQEPLQPGVFEGVPVSTGIVEGKARVLRDPGDAVLAPGEILVAPFTDAAWTTLFVHAGGVVLEAGGAMSHGSVIAREYGIPAVVGLPNATSNIETGQRIRVDGESGRVEILEFSAGHLSSSTERK